MGCGWGWLGKFYGLTTLFSEIIDACVGIIYIFIVIIHLLCGKKAIKVFMLWALKVIPPLKLANFVLCFCGKIGVFFPL